MKSNKNRRVLLLLFASLLVVAMLNYTTADPDGASITSNITSSKASTSPDSRVDARGTITTLTLTALQQVAYWKAYVGNVSGAFTLDDADGYTIYDWQFGNTSVAGRIFASRDGSVTWSQIQCANTTTRLADETALNHTTTDPASITSTFGQSAHSEFFVGSTQITQNSCNSTATYINSTAQTVNSSATFQEVLLQDDSNTVYSTFIHDDTMGYRDDTTYDFQLLVPESFIGSPRTYYFYVELTS